MKKTLILLVFIISMVLLASCGGNDSDKKTISPSASTSDTVKKETSSTKDVTTSDTVKKEPYVWYEYDDDGNVALKEYYNAEDELEKTESFLPNGSPKSVYEYNAEGMAVRYELFSYDELGILVSKYIETGKYLDDGKTLSEKEVFLYNANGTLLTHGSYSYLTSGLLKKSEVKNYDEKGILVYRDVTLVKTKDLYYEIELKRYAPGDNVIRKEISRVTYQGFVSYLLVTEYYNNGKVKIETEQCVSSAGLKNISKKYFKENGECNYSELYLFDENDKITERQEISYYSNGFAKEIIAYSPDDEVLHYAKYYSDGRKKSNLESYIDRSTGKVDHYMYWSYDGPGETINESTSFVEATLGADFSVIDKKFVRYYEYLGQEKSVTHYEGDIITSHREYSEDGRLTAYNGYISQKEIYFEFTYFAPDQPSVEKRYDKNKVFIGKYVYEYYENDICKTKTWVGADGYSYVEQAYYENGYDKIRSTFHSNGSLRDVFEYNESGKLIKHNYYAESDGSTESYTAVYEYHENGMIKSHLTYDTDEKLKRYEYFDENGHRESSLDIEKDDDGNKVNVKREYDSGRIQSEHVYNTEMELISYKIYFWENGLCRKITTYDANDNVISEEIQS